VGIGHLRWWAVCIEVEDGRVQAVQTRPSLPSSLDGARTLLGRAGSAQDGTCGGGTTADAVSETGVVQAGATLDAAVRVTAVAAVDVGAGRFGTAERFDMTALAVGAGGVAFPGFACFAGTLASAAGRRVVVVLVFGALARGLWPGLARDVSISLRATPKFFV
jgi:hypothetical protein